MSNTLPFHPFSFLYTWSINKQLSREFFWVPTNSGFNKQQSLGLNLCLAAQRSIQSATQFKYKTQKIFILYKGFSLKIHYRANRKCISLLTGCGTSSTQLPVKYIMHQQKMVLKFHEYKFKCMVFYFANTFDKCKWNSILLSKVVNRGKGNRCGQLKCIAALIET